jgi:chemotaxis protein methyltransferase CheR
VRRDAAPDALWARLSEWVAAKTGLHFPPERRQDLQRALGEAAAEFGFASAATCADWLLSAPLTGPQLHTLASHLTIGETYFFRERKTFDTLAGQILPQLILSRRGREQRLRLWSAACSTGEEAYSLAILLHQLLPDWQDWQVRILATDINTRSLERASSGVYGEWSFREVPAELRERYFARTGQGRFAVAPEIRERVTFAPLNLAEDGFPSLTTGTNAMDVILCRNVLIYFTPTHARRLVENLRHALVEGGWLAVSPSECSQALFGRFVVVNFPGAILYQKRDLGERPSTAWTPTDTQADGIAADWFPGQSPTPTAPHAAPEASIGPASPAPSEHPQTPSEHTDPAAVAAALYEQGRYAEAADGLLESIAPAARAPLPAPEAAPGSQTFSLLSRALANQGKLTDALAWSEKWLAADRVDASAHYLHAMILQELGQRAASRRSLKRAVYLRPDFALAHFALGNCARAEARTAEADRHFENALRLLRARPPDEPVLESDGLTTGRLIEIIVSLISPGHRE